MSGLLVSVAQDLAARHGEAGELMRRTEWVRSGE
mgnify:CR=1 FL=1